ncbi:hypothetical protein RUM43_008128 [Polyplax serrata]|uniref:Uncharacterized protein n=1 Tax=Polyplax serrata TaxID=468196 RepID=A0AAN8Q6T8_POLSC
MIDRATKQTSKIKKKKKKKKPVRIFPHKLENSWEIEKRRIVSPRKTAQPEKVERKLNPPERNSISEERNSRRAKGVTANRKWSSGGPETVIDFLSDDTTKKVSFWKLNCSNTTPLNSFKF